MRPKGAISDCMDGKHRRAEAVADYEKVERLVPASIILRTVDCATNQLQEASCRQLIRRGIEVTPNGPLARQHSEMLRDEVKDLQIIGVGWSDHIIKVNRTKVNSSFAHSTYLLELEPAIHLHCPSSRIGESNLPAGSYHSTSRGSSTSTSAARGDLASPGSAAQSTFSGRQRITMWQFSLLPHHKVCRRPLQVFE